MKIIFKIVSLIILSNFCYGQIAHYNQFPTLRPTNNDILNGNKDDISFAYSMRLLDYDYTGPLIRLRRSNDNAEEDFFPADNDLLDTQAIAIWAATANLFVVTWYDQSGLARNAVQNITDRQPQYFNDASEPYFVGDGDNDLLVIPVSIQILTEGGKNGSVFGIFYAVNRADIAFGTISGNNRWITHINWSNGQTYFDPGSCCQGGRSFLNNSAPPTGGLNAWDQYTFVRRDDPDNAAIDRRLLRLGGEQKQNLGYADNLRCSLNFNMGIAGPVSNANDDGVIESTTRFIEMIMYAKGKEDNFIEEIEQNQIGFWGL